MHALTLNKPAAVKLPYAGRNFLKCKEIAVYDHSLKDCFVLLNFCCFQPENQKVKKLKAEANILSDIVKRKPDQQVVTNQSTFRWG
jgi:hypothetical protein